MHKKLSAVNVHDLGRDMSRLSYDLNRPHREWGPQLLTALGSICDSSAQSW